MTDLPNQVFEFEGYRLDVSKRSVTGPDGEPLRLLPKAFDILTYLIENASRVVSKDELMSHIWHDTVVEENNLTQNVSSLRRAFGEKPSENRFISTIPGRGYRFVADVRDVGNADLTPTPISERSIAKNDPVRGGDGRSWKSRPILFAAAAGLLIVGAIVTAAYLYRGGASPERIRSIAVLPFKPITFESRDEALEIGMADTLITKIGGGEELRVMPLAAVRRFTSPDLDPIEAGRQLGVDSVLDGGIQIVSGRVRISAKLIRVSDGHQLWAGQFDEDMRGMFDVQDSISQRVASALATTMATRGRKSITQNVEAYRFFMQGRYHAYKLILPEVQKGIAFYEQAISLDPQFAMAYVELSNSYRAMVLTNNGVPKEMMPRAKAAALKAVELDETLAEAWTAMAFSEFWFDWDWGESETHFKRALELDPESAQAHAFYAHLLSNIGRHEEALAQIKRAREIDPINLLYAAMEGQIMTFAGQMDRSDLVLRSIIDLDPNFWLAHLFITRNYIEREMWPEALASALRAKEITRGNAEAAGTVAYILGRQGRNDEARAVIAELETDPLQRFTNAYALSQAYLAIGDKNKAVEHLEKAFEQKEPFLVFLKVEPKWNELHADARFTALLKRLKLDQ